MPAIGEPIEFTQCDAQPFRELSSGNNRAPRAGRQHGGRPEVFFNHRQPQVHRLSMQLLFEKGLQQQPIAWSFRKLAADSANQLAHPVRLECGSIAALDEGCSRPFAI